MGAPNSIVFELGRDARPALVIHLAERQGRALSPGSCTVELTGEGAPTLHVIVSWQRAVPLKVERLALAVMAAGGVLRRDLTADEVRRDARAAGRAVTRLSTRAQVAAYSRDLAPAARTAPAAGLRSLRPAA